MTAGRCPSGRVRPAAAGEDETNAYLHAGGVLATIDGSDDPLYLLNDALGSVRGVTDEAGDVDGTADYAVYGETRASSGVSTLFRFTGEQHDTETGFTYLRARYANPALGRFVSADMVQPNAPGTQGYNPYAYVAGNPTTWVDPSGHVAMEAGLALGRFVLTLQFIDPTLIVRTVNRCGANAFCLTGVGTIALSAVACALDVSGGCLLGAFEDAGVINWLGSAGYSDAACDSWEKLKDALKKWPWLPAAPLLPLLQDTIDKIDFWSPGGGGGGGGCPTGQVNMHHVIPTEILRGYLPEDIANNSQIRGVKGQPNRICIPQELHRSIHDKGVDGVRYNNAWKQAIERVTASKGSISVDDVLAIRNELIQKYGLGPYVTW